MLQPISKWRSIKQVASEVNRSSNFSHLRCLHVFTRRMEACLENDRCISFKVFVFSCLKNIFFFRKTSNSSSRFYG